MTRRSDKRAEFLASVMTTAIEGGINYWASVGGYRWGFSDLGKSDGSKLGDGEQAFATATIYDDEESGEISDAGMKVDIETIAKGIRLVSDGKTSISSGRQANAALANRTNGDDGDIDADIADCILQAGMFGEVVYG